MAENCKLVGVDPKYGIQYLVRESDGVDFYYNPKTKSTAMSLRGIARMLRCQHNTISKLAGKLNLKKEAELLTRKGLKWVSLVTEDNIADLLEAIAKSRMKKETRNRATEILKKYARAGFKLQVMLEVAPEEVAKEAIRRIDDESKIKEVQQTAQIQQFYIENHHGVNNQLMVHDCEAKHYAGYHSQVNRHLKVPNGQRSKMDDKTRLKMGLMCGFGQLALMEDETPKKWKAVNVALDAGRKALPC